MKLEEWESATDTPRKVVELRPILDDLTTSGFRLSGRLYVAVLERAGETMPGEGAVGA